jgi:tRNA-specific 2-thiouridylase
MISDSRVVVGMSGGVDSSVAAYLLKAQGYEVIGVTMKVWPQDCMSRAEDKCCGPQAVADARGVAHALGIPHYVVDEAEAFEKTVIDYFASEYQQGRTPNPCVMCNEKLKFGNLMEKATRLGAKYIATGHYAQIIEEKGRFILKRGADARKDQSYFLFSLRQEQLARSLMPIGDKTKTEIRSIAEKLGLKVYDKEESQEICFVPGNDYTDFLRSHVGAENFRKGGIYDLQGNYLGEHEGIEFYTIGQRKGLGGGSQGPRYVVDIDAKQHRVIVGNANDLLRESFTIGRCVWNFTGSVPDSFEVEVKVRHQHVSSSATVFPQANQTALVKLKEPQRAITPGQAAVCYLGDQVIGGGWIEREIALLPNEPAIVVAGK